MECLCILHKPSPQSLKVENFCWGCVVDESWEDKRVSLCPWLNKHEACSLFAGLLEDVLQRHEISECDSFFAGSQLLFFRHDCRASWARDPAIGTESKGRQSGTLANYDFFFLHSELWNSQLVGSTVGRNSSRDALSFVSANRLFHLFDLRRRKRASCPRGPSARFCKTKICSKQLCPCADGCSFMAVGL